METRQDASITLIPPHALSELRQFLSSTGATLTIADAVSAAISKWLAHQPAAAAMNQALKAAVALIEHVDDQSTTVLERRLPKNRRAIDLLEDIE